MPHLMSWPARQQAGQQRRGRSSSSRTRHQTGEQALLQGDVDGGHSRGVSAAVCDDAASRGPVEAAQLNCGGPVWWRQLQRLPAHVQSPVGGKGVSCTVSLTELDPVH